MHVCACVCTMGFTFTPSFRVGGDPGRLLSSISGTVPKLAMHRVRGWMGGHPACAPPERPRTACERVCPPPSVSQRWGHKCNAAPWRWERPHSLRRQTRLRLPRARPASRERLRGAVGKDTPRVQPGCLFCLGAAPCSPPADWCWRWR